MCSNYYTLTPSVDDHDIDNYMKYIMEPVDHFKQRDKKKTGSFEESLINSCRAGEKKKRSDLERGVQNVAMYLMKLRRGNVKKEFTKMPTKLM